MLLSTKQIAERLKSGSCDARLSRIYADVDAARKRYLSALAAFEKKYGASEHAAMISAPGRTEVSGNHTDHQRGVVLAASVDMDAVAVVSKRDDMKIRILSEGYRPSELDITSTAKIPAEEGKTSALIRGMADGFIKRGLKVGGFDIYVQSDVISGSGLSSSACFEVLIGTVLSYLYNEDTVAPLKIAMIGQYAENEYFGKPCGLMDQMACAVGGLVKIDFKDKTAPDFRKVVFEPEKHGFRMCIVDTGGSHADLTDEYAAVPADMKNIAKHLGKDVLRELEAKDVEAKIPELREKFGDRAVMRALHFFEECDRVERQCECLDKNDVEGFFALAKEAGASCVMYNQNAFTCKNVKEQGVTLGLMLCSKILKNRGAYRLQGGGFAGTIQAYVPEDLLSEFIEKTEAVFGKGKCHVVNIRQSGAVIFD